MNDRERATAIGQLAGILQELHSVGRPQGVSFIDSPPQMLGPSRLGNPISPLYEGLDQLANLPTADPEVVAMARRELAERAPAINDCSDDFLIHGDTTFENVLWDGHRVTALVDFEWCRGGPADLDLDVLFRFFAIPHGHVADDYVNITNARDYLSAPRWLLEAYPDLFRHDQLADRLWICLLYTSPSPRDATLSRMPSSA